MASDWVLALDLGGTDLKAARMREDGTLVGFSRRPSRTAESRDAPFAAIVEAAAELGAGGAPLAVGLGCPGVIDPRSGALRDRTAHLPHWCDVPVREELARRLGRLVVVDNDANVAALAEHTVGAARGARVSITVTLGTGIGFGIVIEGRVLRGAHGGAGELGHAPLGGVEPCECGVPGCAEPEASASGLLRRARAAGIEAADVAAVFARAAAGDGLAARLIAGMADRLGAVIAVGVDVIDPEVVVVGGGVAQAGEALFGPLREAVRRYALPSHAGVRVVPAALGERAGTVGAGLLAWERVRRSG
jgi:glucokinase